MKYPVSCRTDNAEPQLGRGQQPNCIFNIENTTVMLRVAPGYILKSQFDFVIAWLSELAVEKMKLPPWT
jgi:hypothetical protein